MDEMLPPPFVHCCNCSRPIIISLSDGPGSLITCVFCHAPQVIRELTVLVTEAAESA